MLILMTDNLESFEGILNERLTTAQAGHHGKIKLLQIVGMGPVSDEDLDRTTKQRQIGGIVDPAFLGSFPGWESGVTPNAFAQYLLEKFGGETLSEWYEKNKAQTPTETRRTVQVKSAIADALAKKNDNQKTA